MSEIRETVSTVTFGIGWDEVNAGDRSDLDLDLSAYALSSAGRVVTDEHFIFFNNGASPDGAIRHTGLPSGPHRETLVVDTAQLAPQVDSVVVGVTAYNGEGNFGRFSGGHISVSDGSGPAAAPLARYDLYLHMAGAQAVAYGRIYRDGDAWRFAALGDRFDSLGAMAAAYGVNV